MLFIFSLSHFSLNGIFFTHIPKCLASDPIVCLRIGPTIILEFEKQTCSVSFCLCSICFKGNWLGWGNENSIYCWRRTNLVKPLRRDIRQHLSERKGASRQQPHSYFWPAEKSRTCAPGSTCKNGHGNMAGHIKTAPQSPY